MPPKVSFIIRTMNEEEWLGETLRRIFLQTFTDFEVIIVDSGSTDKTLDIIQEFIGHGFPVRLIQISREEFSYPSALNLGCCNALATHCFVVLSAHALPTSNQWLEYGLRSFSDKRVAGVFAANKTLSVASFWEKLFYVNSLVELGRKLKLRLILRRPVFGIGVTFPGAIIRRDLWDRHGFDEAYGAGGEDQVWARYWLKHGHFFVMDYAFSIEHSHQLSLKGLLQQFKWWDNMGLPKPFRRQDLDFRHGQYS